MLPTRCGRLLVIIPLLTVIVGCGLVTLKGRGKDPLSAREHFTLGSIYEKRGESDLALREYELALENDSRFLPAMTRIAELSYRMKRYAKAERYYRKAIEMSPRDGDLYNNLSWVYVARGKRLKEAKSLIMRAMELTPEHKGYYLDTLGVIYIKQRRYSEAIEALEAAIPFFDETQLDLVGQVYRHLGLAYDGIGEGSKAEEAYHKARDILHR